MIEPDKYAEEYFNLKYPFLHKEQTTKIYNFNKLPTEKKIVFIKLEIMLNPSLTIIERIDWDLSEENKCPEKFSELFIHNLKDLIDKDLISYNKYRISKQIYSQILEHIDKNTIFTKLKVGKKDGDIFQVNNTTVQNSQNFSEITNNKNLSSSFINNPNNFYCVNCNSYCYNSDNCLNCSNYNEKKNEKNLINQSFNNGNSTNNINTCSNNEEIQRQTERQKILEMRQKNLNLNESVAVSYTNEGKEKKICKKCGEINMRSAAECRDCKHKFPLVTHFDINVDQTYSVHFWDKISKNSTIQQLKNFADFFIIEDFCSLKYLYEKVKMIIKTEYEEILTEEAIADVYNCLEKAYFALSNTTITTEKIFENSYLKQYGKNRPKIRLLNFNNLTDIKEGWLPDNFPDFNIEEKKEERLISLDDASKRRRGRPKKMEIFKADLEKELESQITLQDRDFIFKNDLIIDDEDMHYDFCGKCQEPGKLICCETCSSAYHFECLGYEKFPRGKYKCYFCKIVKSGIDEAISVDKEAMKLIKKLISYNRKNKWYSKAEEFLDVIKEHHCSMFFYEPVPEDFKIYYEKVKEPRDLNMISTKLENKEYSRLKEFTDDLFLLWSNMREFYNEKSFIHRQAKTMEEFMIHLIRNEGIFDLFLNEDEKKENERLKRKDSKDNFDEIKIPKKRGRKPRNYIEMERLKELEKKLQNSNDQIDLNLNLSLSKTHHSLSNFHKFWNVENSCIFKSHVHERVSSIHDKNMNENENQVEIQMIKEENYEKKQKEEKKDEEIFVEI